MSVFDRFVKRMDPRKRSEFFRRALRNSSWNTLDYLILPLLFLVATPFLIAKLGTEQFGIWMLVNALTGALGIMHFGLGDATIKYASAYRARSDWESVVRVIRSTQTIYGILGLISGVSLWVAAPLLAQHAFKIGPAHHLLAVSAIRIGGVGLGLRFLNSVFAGALQGFERYDLSARVNIVVKGLTIGAIVAAAAMGHGIRMVLWISVGFSAAGTLVFALVLRSLIPHLSFWPMLHRKSLREVFGFGFYTWLQAIAGTIFSQADVLLVGGLLGTAAVTYYSVCQRVAMQIHSTLAASCAFLFPMSSGALELGGIYPLRKLYMRSLNLIVVLSTVLGTPLFLFSGSILTFWLGADFAVHGSNVLRVLTFGYAMLAVSIVPHNILNGTGHVRANTILSWSSLIVAVAGVFAFTPAFGLVGVAWAKVLNVAPLIAAMIFLQRRVLGAKSTTSIVAPFLPAICLFGAALAAIRLHGDFHPNKLTSLASMIVLSMIGAAALGFSIQRMIGLHRVSSECELGQWQKHS